MFVSPAPLPKNFTANILSAYKIFVIDNESAFMLPETVSLAEGARVPIPIKSLIEST